MEFKKPQGDQTLEAVEGLVVSSLINVFSCLCVLFHIRRPPPSNTHLDLKIEHLNEDVAVLFVQEAPSSFNATGS